MLVGTADPLTLARRAPVMPSLDTEALVLEPVETLQVHTEILSDGLEKRLPPALHPTLPVVVSWWVQRFPVSPWGAFHLAQTRIECRSGLRPRGFLVAGVTDNAEALGALEGRWGYTLLAGEVELHRSYHEVRAEVSVAARDVLSLGLRDPEPLKPTEVQYVANMNLATTPRGLRLVQVDPVFEIERAERGVPWVASFDSVAWGDAGIEPTYTVAASFTVGKMTLPALRYVCRADALAFDGTERL